MSLQINVLCAVIDHVMETIPCPFICIFLFSIHAHILTKKSCHDLCPNPRRHELAYLSVSYEIFIFKVVMATNRIETLDPALIRPGRIDRKIEFPLPDEKTKRRIFNIHTSRMTLAEDVNLTELIMSKDDLSGADIKVRKNIGFFFKLLI